MQQVVVRELCGVVVGLGAGGGGRQRGVGFERRAGEVELEEGVGLDEDG